MRFNFKIIIRKQRNAFFKSFVLFFVIFSSFGQDLKRSISDVESKVIKWRHHIHKNPELSNREFKTAELVADHLKSLGIKVKTGVAHTGVVGILKGNKPGKVVALRADMDALPVTERNRSSLQI